MVCAIDILDMEPIDGVNFYQESIECIDNISEIKKLKGSFNLVISDIAPNLSGIGAIDNDKEVTYKIVGNLESDPEKGDISIDTPIAKGLVGKFVEDEIKIETPSGSLNFEILEVKHI